MRLDLFVGHHAGNGIALLIDHRGGNAHDIAAIAVGRGHLLNGVTGGAGDTIFIELAVHLGILGERAG